MRLPLLAMLGLSAAPLAAQDSSVSHRAVERVAVVDPAGDPEDGNYKRFRDRTDLDARRVVVERSGKALKVTWETSGVPTRSIIYAFNAYTPAGNEVAAVEVRLR
jgi:hypothetical protein